MVTCDIKIYEGQGARFVLTYKNTDGELADPSAIRFMHRAPSDTETTTWTYGDGAEIVRDSLGVFHVDLEFDEAGVWKWRHESDGLETADQGQLRVVAANL